MKSVGGTLDRLVSFIVEKVGSDFYVDSFDCKYCDEDNDCYVSLQFHNLFLSVSVSAHLDRYCGGILTMQIDSDYLGEMLFNFSTESSDPDFVQYVFDIIRAVVFGVLDRFSVECLDVFMRAFLRCASYEKSYKEYLGD